MIASDDFTVSSVLMAAMHATSAACALTVINSDGKMPSCLYVSNSGALAVQALGCVAAVAAGVLLIMAFSSSRGRIFQPSKRFLVPMGLYVVMLLSISAFALSCYLLNKTVTTREFATCVADGTETRVKLAAAFALVAASWLFLRIVTSFSFMPKNVADMETYEEHWVARCRILCCCYTNHRHANDAFAEAAKVLASLFRGMDVVPSDIAAGFLLVQGFQARQRKNFAKGVTYPASSTIRETKSHQARPLPPISDEQRAKLESIHYYSKYFIGAYGWLLYQFEHMATGVCRLCAADCKASCRDRSGIHYPDCCFCNNTAMQKYIGLRDDDILLTSFDNTIYKPCFYVALDRASGSLIVAIRGSQSLQDAITDIVALPVEIEVDTMAPGTCFVHNGMLRSAGNVLDLLEKHQILAGLLTGVNQNKKIVIVGHSLGAGTATIMAILLWSRFPQLRTRMECIAYAPPGGLLSKDLSEFTRRFVVAPFMGFDVVPRMASHTFDELRQSMLSALAYTSKSKAGIAVRCCCPGTLADSLPAELPANFPAECEVVLTKVQKPHLVPDQLPMVMYPPAALVHYVKVVKRHTGACTSEDVYCPLFVGVEEVQTVLCHPMMLFDHFPDRLFATLARTAGELKTRQLERFFLTPDASDSTAQSSGSMQDVSMKYMSPTVKAAYGSFA